MNFAFSHSAHAAAPHPRVWLTPARLTTLKKYYTQNTQRWQNVKAVADRGDNYANAALLAQALLYQVTGDASYCKGLGKAIDLLMIDAVPSNNLQGDSAYFYRTLPPDIAAYDWCYDQMTPAQRQQAATWLMNLDDWVWPETNSSRSGAWGLWASNNYYYGFLMSWPAALAVQGDGTDTGAPVSYCTSQGFTTRADCHAALGLKKYNTDVVPLLEGWNKGGLFGEGTNYDATRYLAWQVDAYLTATTQDLFNDPSSTYMHDSLLFRIYSTTPRLDEYYHLGDQPRVSQGPLSDYDRQKALIPALSINDATLKQQIQWWLDTINPNNSAWDFQRAWEFLYYREAADQSTQDYAALPTSYFLPGQGFLLKRSDWTPNATYWGIWAGPLLESHQDRDVNGFLIYKNGWLASNGNYSSHSGIHQETEAHNNFTFGTFIDQQGGTRPRDQQWTDNAGSLIKKDIGSDYTYFAGQASAGYNYYQRAYGMADWLNDYTRKWISLAGDTIFIVYDRLVLSDGTLPKEWHIHSEGTPTVNGRSFVLNNGSAKLFGQSLLPASVSITMQADTDATSTNVTEHVSDNSKNDFFLNVLQTAPMSATSVPMPQAIATSGNSMEGALVNGWAVLVGRTESVSGTVSYTLTGASLHHVITDLQSFTNYTITRRDATGTVLGTASAATTLQGTLRFDISDTAAVQFVLTPAGTAVDTTSPSGPTSLMLTSVSAIQINAFWPAATDNVSVAGYRLTVSINSDFSSPLASYANKDLGNVLNTAITGLSAATLYYANVTAYDPAGNVSAGASSSATTQTAGSGPPPPPPGNVFQVTSPSTLTPDQALTASAVNNAATYQWDITPDNTASTLHAAAIAHAAGNGFSQATSAPSVGLRLFSGISFGHYLVTVTALDASGNSLASAQAHISVVSSDLSSARVYPNPWRADQHAGHSITFDSLTANSTVKLFTVSGHWVKTLDAPAGLVKWDLANDSGDKVASGLYLYLITNDQGQKASGKLAIIR